MGVELAAAIIGLTLVGWWVDRRFGTAPKGLIVGASVGVVGGFYNFIRQALALVRMDEETRQRSKRTPGGRDTAEHDRTTRQS